MSIWLSFDPWHEVMASNPAPPGRLRNVQLADPAMLVFGWMQKKLEQLQPGMGKESKRGVHSKGLTSARSSRTSG